MAHNGFNWKFIFAVCLIHHEWIPLAELEINNQNVSTRRHGDSIPYLFILLTHKMNAVYGNITVCNFSLTDSYQVRWLVQQVINLSKTWHLMISGV